MQDLPICDAEWELAACFFLLFFAAGRFRPRSTSPRHVPCRLLNVSTTFGSTFSPETKWTDHFVCSPSLPFVTLNETPTQVLGEIPRQVVDYMAHNKIIPGKSKGNPPPDAPRYQPSYAGSTASYAGSTASSSKPTTPRASTPGPPYW